MLEQYSGPIPPPDLLRQYDELIEGGAERIFNAFESQTRHRMGIESAVVFGNEGRANRGQWMAYSLALVILTLGSIMIFTGREEAGVAMITVDLVGLVAVFITSKRSQRLERQAKYQLGGN